MTELDCTDNVWVSFRVNLAFLCHMAHKYVY